MQDLNPNVPLIGIKDLMEVEKDPVKIEHIPDQKVENSVYQFIIEKKEIKCTPVNENTVKFTFFDLDTINPGSITLHMAIGNLNNNYLQLDSTPHSLIKKIRWIYKGKILEEIDDYHILANLLTDIHYNPTKQNSLTDITRPLTVTSKEVLIAPETFGTNAIFNPFVRTDSYIESYNISNGMVDMTQLNYKEFSFKPISFLFRSAENKLLNLATFPDLELEITLNRYAFFVPVFNASIGDLSGFTSNAFLNKLKGDPEFSDFSQLILNNADTFKPLRILDHKIDPCMAIFMLLCSLYSNLSFNEPMVPQPFALIRYEKEFIMYGIILKIFVSDNIQPKTVPSFGVPRFSSIDALYASQTPMEDLLNIVNNFDKRIILAFRLSMNYVNNVRRTPRVLSFIFNIPISFDPQEVERYFQNKNQKNDILLIAGPLTNRVYVLGDNYHFYIYNNDTKTAVDLNIGTVLRLTPTDDPGHFNVVVDQTFEFQPYEFNYRNFVNHFFENFNENFHEINIFRDIFMYTDDTRYEVFNVELLRLYYTITQLQQFHSKEIIRDLIYSKLQRIYNKRFPSSQIPPFHVLFDNFNKYINLKNSDSKLLNSSLAYQSSDEYQNMNQQLSKLDINDISREFTVYKCNLSYELYKNNNGMKINIEKGWKNMVYYYFQMEKLEFHHAPPQKIFHNFYPNALKNIYHLIYNSAYYKYPTYRALNRYNRHIRNMWIEVDGRKLPKEVIKTNCADTSENSLYRRLGQCFPLDASAINPQNFAIDNNTQLYLTMKLNGLPNNLIKFGNTISYDKFLFGYHNEIVSKAILGLNMLAIKEGLTKDVSDSISFDRFEVHFENDLPHKSTNSLTDFDSYEMYTYGECIMTFEFDSNGLEVSKKILFTPKLH